jgi:hypothetical protein
MVTQARSYAFFSQATITGNIYLGMTENFAYLQLEEDKIKTFERDSVPPCYNSTVCDALN